MFKVKWEKINFPGPIDAKDTPKFDVQARIKETNGRIETLFNEMDSEKKLPSVIRIASIQGAIRDVARANKKLWDDLYKKSSLDFDVTYQNDPYYCNITFPEMFKYMEFINEFSAFLSSYKTLIAISEDNEILDHYENLCSGVVKNLSDLKLKLSSIDLYSTFHPNFINVMLKELFDVYE